MNNSFERAVQTMKKRSAQEKKRNKLKNSGNVKYVQNGNLIKKVK
jgi:hypothetical protein